MKCKVLKCNVWVTVVVVFFFVSFRIQGRGISLMIERHASLTCLQLDNNKLGDTGATAIGNALVHNIVLESLQLNWYDTLLCWLLKSLVVSLFIL